MYVNLVLTASAKNDIKLGDNEAYAAIEMYGKAAAAVKVHRNPAYAERTNFTSDRCRSPQA